MDKTKENPACQAVKSDLFYTTICLQPEKRRKCSLKTAYPVFRYILDMVSLISGTP